MNTNFSSYLKVKANPNIKNSRDPIFNIPTLKWRNIKYKI